MQTKTAHHHQTTHTHTTGPVVVPVRGRVVGVGADAEAARAAVDVHGLEDACGGLRPLLGVMHAVLGVHEAAAADVGGSVSA